MIDIPMLQICSDYIQRLLEVNYEVFLETKYFILESKNTNFRGFHKMVTNQSQFNIIVQ